METENPGEVTSTTSASTNHSQTKKPRSSLFVSYVRRIPSTVTVQATPMHCTLHSYLESATASPNATLKDIISNEQFKNLNRFISAVYCVLAVSALVERIFNHGGIFIRPHRVVQKNLHKV